MIHEVYDYHESNTSPLVENPTAKIFGMELEIDDSSETAREILDRAIEDDILTSPENEHRTHNMKKIERDSSVYREIILRANYKQELKRMIKNLNYADLNPDWICNSRGTSCHIHMNRAYLSSRGITETNIFKLFELYTPIIYRISGRNEDSFFEWAEPRTGLQRVPIDWERQAERVSNATVGGNRYYMVNVEKFKSIELRAFSNYCNFDYKTLCFYLDFVDFCISQAESMRGKYYINEFPRLLEELERWIKTVYPNFYRLYRLKEVFNYNPHLDRLKFAYRVYKEHQLYEIRYIKRGHYTDREVLNFIWLNRKFGNITRLTLTPQGMQNSICKIENQVYKELAGHFREFQRTLTHEELTQGGI